MMFSYTHLCILYTLPVPRSYSGNEQEDPDANGRLNQWGMYRAASIIENNFSEADTLEAARL